MAKTKWFKLTGDIVAKFEDRGGSVGSVQLRKNMEIETGRNTTCVLLENGDVMWGLTRIPKEILVKMGR